MVFAVLHIIYPFVTTDAFIFDSNDPIFEEYEDLLSIGKNYSVALSVINSISSVVVSIGFWLLWKNCKDSVLGSFKTSGLSILKISLIVAYISNIAYYIFLYCYGDVIRRSITIPDDFTRDFTSIYRQPEYIIGSALSIIILSGIGAIVLYGFYYAKSYKMIKSVKNILSTGRPSDYIPMYVVVMNYIFAFSAVSQIENVITLLRQGTFAAFLIIMSVLIIRYRNQMRAIVYQSQSNSFLTANSPDFNA